MYGRGLQARAETPEEPPAQAASLPQPSTSRAAHSKEQPGAIPKGDVCSSLPEGAHALVQISMQEQRLSAVNFESSTKSRAALQDCDAQHMHMYLVCMQKYLSLGS